MNTFYCYQKNRQFHCCLVTSEPKIRKDTDVRKKSSVFPSTQCIFPFGAFVLLLLLPLFYLGQIHFDKIIQKKNANLMLTKHKDDVDNHGSYFRPPLYTETFNINQLASNAKNLIIVAGHSVIVSGHLYDAVIDENIWYLLDYQKGHGILQAIISHIRLGIQEAAKDPYSLLVFSGGETRPFAGPISEGTSYFCVADAMNLWNGPETNENTYRTNFSGADTVRSRSISEEFATDSFTNLLFSICRFKEVTGSYPKNITVVSFTFKRRRFAHLHAEALRWKPEAFKYIGIDADVSTGFDLDASIQGEITNAVIPYENDPYGCHTNALLKKRTDRNPFYRTPPYELTCPEMKYIFHWCGPQLISPSSVPW